jgi:predicted DNA-binding transcriptional regulator AlpA
MEDQTVRQENLDNPREVQTPDDSHCLNEHDVSMTLKVSIALLRKWRRVGGGPPFVRLGRSVRYVKSGLKGWLQAREVH